jgi:hypothetical protein
MCDLVAADSESTKTDGVGVVPRLCQKQDVDAVVAADFKQIVDFVGE